MILTMQMIVTCGDYIAIDNTFFDCSGYSWYNVIKKIYNSLVGYKKCLVSPF